MPCERPTTTIVPRINDASGGACKQAFSFGAFETGPEVVALSNLFQTHNMHRTRASTYDESDTSSYASDGTADGLSEEEESADALEALPGVSHTVEKTAIPRLSLGGLGQSSGHPPSIPAIRLPSPTAEPLTARGDTSRPPPAIPALNLGAANRAGQEQGAPDLQAAQQTQRQGPAAMAIPKVGGIGVPALNLGGMSNPSKTLHQGIGTLPKHAINPGISAMSDSGASSSDSDRSSSVQSDESFHRDDAASRHLQPQPMHLDAPTRTHTPTITIDLLSAAFSLDPSDLAGPHSEHIGGKSEPARASSGSLIQACSQRLGIPGSHLRLFSLQKVTSQQATPGRNDISHFAVAVDGSGDCSTESGIFQDSHMEISFVVGSLGSVKSKNPSA